MTRVEPLPLAVDQPISVAFDENGRVSWCEGCVVDGIADRVQIVLDEVPSLPLEALVGAELSLDSWRPMDARYLSRARVVAVRPGSRPILDLQILKAKRVQHRHAFRVPVTVTPNPAMLLGRDGQERSISLELRDLSAGGLGGISDLPLAVGDVARIALRVAAGAEPIEIEGRVVRVEEVSPGWDRPVRVGIAFVGVSPPVHEQLVHWTLMLQAEKLRRERR